MSKFHMTRAEVEQLEQHIEKRAEAYRACHPGRPVILDLTDIDGRKLDFCRLARSYEYRLAVFQKCETMRVEAKAMQEQAAKWRARSEVVAVEQKHAEASGRAAPRRKRTPTQLEKDADRVEKEAIKLWDAAEELWNDLPE